MAQRQLIVEGMRESALNHNGQYLVMSGTGSLVPEDPNEYSDVYLLSLTVPASDTDGDANDDAIDNCTQVPNPAQRDTDGDGYGNICDADLNQDLQTNLTDFSLFRGAFGTADPDADFNGSGSVDLTDFSFFRGMFGSPPGPSGLNP